MSIPTPASSAVAPTPGMPAIDTSISIQDLESGKVDIDALIKEIEELKSRIAKLRYDMVVYVRLLGSIDESTHPSSMFTEIQNQINIIKANIDSYYLSYKRLLPVIRYTKLKSGMNPDDTIKVEPHKVKIENVVNKIESRSSITAPPNDTTSDLSPTMLGITANSPPSSTGNTTSFSAPNTGSAITSQPAAKKPAPKKPRQKKADTKAGPGIIGSNGNNPIPL